MNIVGSIHQSTPGEDASTITDDRTDRLLGEAHLSDLFQESLPLCGRIKERDQLLAAFKEVSSSPFTTKMVVVRGPSGCGKSALVEKTFRNAFDDGSTTKGWFVTGKFHQYGGRNDPFSAVIAAITNLIDLIEHVGVVHLYERSVREAIKGDETNFGCLIPNLSSVTNRQYEITSMRPPHSMVFRRFVSTFKALLSALSHREYPLVLFLDDLQWMDDSSFELLQALIGPNDTSSSTGHLLLIGAIRSDDLWTETILSRFDSCGMQSCASELTYIDVVAVDQNTTAHIIAARLRLPPNSCSSLGSVIYHKTMGSPFALLRFLDLVASKGLLVYEDNSWVWDESKLMSETNVSNNVLELVQQNVQLLSKPLTDLLTIAAFLGYEFRGSTLSGVLVRCDTLGMFADLGTTEGEILGHLNRACKEGLVETTEQPRGGWSSYKFSHDKIQQAFYVSLSDADAQLLHRAIGLYLWDEAGEKAAIEVANHLNRTGPFFVSEATLVGVNYAAAKLARSRAAYPLSANYIRHALNLLGTDKWTTHYHLSLEMSTCLLELCVACGDDTEIDLVLGEVSEHGLCLEDKLPAMYSKVRFLGSSCRYWEAITYGTTVVRLCGKTIPKTPNLIHIVLLLSDVRRRAAKLTDEDIIELPSVQDKKIEYLLQLYSRIGTYAIMMDLDTLPIFCALRAAQLSMEQGVSPATPMALALLGIAEAATGSFSAAARFGRLVTRMLDEREMGPETTAQSLSLVSCSVLHWTEPIDERYSMVPKKAMEVGVQGGELEFGYFAATLCFSLELARGKPLNGVEQHAREACLKMKDFKLESVLSIAKVSWQYALNLLGQSEQPTVLSGEAMNETEHMNDPSIKESSTQRIVLTYRKFNLARLHGSYELAKQLATDLNTRFKDYPLKSTFNVYEIKMHLALLWYHFARKGGGGRQGRKYLSKARLEVKYMKAMRRRGCPNFDSALRIVEAEEASCSKDLPTRHVQALYDGAISSASGKLHLEAIALEQAALYLIGRDDLASGAMYMRRAVSKYLEWNAYAKAADLVNKFGHVTGVFPEDDIIGNMTLYLPSGTISRSP